MAAQLPGELVESEERRIVVSKSKVHATFYGNNSKYEVIESPKALFGDSQFDIYKDGELHSGSFIDLAAAVEAAKEESDN